MERERQRITRRVLSKKIGYLEGQILAWELGKVRPDFMSVFNWAEALGFDLTLKPKVTAELIDAVVVPWPDKKRMMGSR